MSELFVVYGRGGFDQFDDDERGMADLLRNVSDVRDADQFLIKLRYRREERRVSFPRHARTDILSRGKCAFAFP